MEKPLKQNKPAEASPSVIYMRTLKTYQPVQLNQKLDTHFTNKRQGMEDIVIEFHVDKQLIHLYLGKKDHKIIVPANVAWMEPVE